MKTQWKWKLAVLAGLGALAVTQASASLNLVVNGDFESGDTGFTSGYGDVTGIANGLATGGDDPAHLSGEGLYAVGGNANYYHSAFTTAGPESGNQMMIVNGSTIPGKNVWTGTLSPDMTVGVTYLFSAWVMNVYHDTDPAHQDAELEFSIGGNLIGTFSAAPATAGVWSQFTAFYTPGTAGQLPTSVDLKVNYYANDFALDNISLTAVPEPTTMIAGALLLLPFGASTVRILRRNRMA
jgi:hypothetical protein